MSDIKLIDDVLNDVVAKWMHSQIAFELRDKAGVFPFKVRTTVFTKDEAGAVHSTEIENAFMPEDALLEESYRAHVKRLVLMEAKEAMEQKP